MNMTQAIVATSYGGADVLEFRDITTPGPGPGQVLINVKAAGVNPIDWKLYSGAFGTDPDKLPMRLGLEISGTIAAVGAGVDGLVPGDDVIAAGQIGGYATRVIAAADQVFKKPASLSFNEAAGFLLTGQTAVHLLEATNVTEGDTVLIHGAAGGVGLLATQLAKARGATVIATASAARHDQLRGYGALPVEYGPGLQERVSAIGPVDAALDLVGTDEAADVSLALVADKGRIGHYRRIRPCRKRWLQGTRRRTRRGPRHRNPACRASRADPASGQRRAEGHRRPDLSAQRSSPSPRIRADGPRPRKDHPAALANPGEQTLSAAPAGVWCTKCLLVEVPMN
ncbi:Putative oxidoreductase [Mycobacteroides abscessus]|uniref:Oxidoreductase n=1 Tax=Mycobacteroides abscessus subsp. massiliense TaxID=1962118 RepID=A0AB38DJG5_9MYCO|nr:Putative oxidoreductase [Mycobacteroides abscessus]SKD27244.1 Putative oxidoreductase [Mycobacteroides abscessus subsp. massiliense]CPS53822.1 Putative oxidoreductase [Mycobacteroides abscessus]CPT13170.1 Putative oxidoreductase [Mycobacteroides abscessus]CPT76870.1 Putative oxidoreductase [Mycobacteroides abscessus]